MLCPELASTGGLRNISGNSWLHTAMPATMSSATLADTLSKRVIGLYDTSRILKNLDHLKETAGWHRMHGEYGFVGHLRLRSFIAASDSLVPDERHQSAPNPYGACWTALAAEPGL